MGLGIVWNNSFNETELNRVILTFFTDAFSSCVGFTSSIKYVLQGGFKLLTQATFSRQGKLSDSYSEHNVVSVLGPAQGERSDLPNGLYSLASTSSSSHAQILCLN